MGRMANRRDFLRGKAAMHAMGDLIEQALPELPAPPPSPPAEATTDSYLLHLTRRAMASEFQLLFNAGQYPNATEAAMEALDLIETLEEQLSVFRATSEVSRINFLAAEGPITVDPRLFEILQLAQRLYEETGGAYDITSTALWRVWGFARREGRLPTPADLDEARRHVGGQQVELMPENHSVRFRQAGVELNLGSIGKGYALDRAAELLESAGIGDFLIHGGQSSVLARGTRCDGRSAAGWSVGIQHPLRRGVRLGELTLKDRALGTSGSANQFFRYRGHRYGHIIDPRSGQPAEGVLSSTVLAPSGALADALSTAFFVLGPEKSLEYCQSRPELAAVLVCTVANGERFEIRTAGLAEGEFKVLAEW